MTSEVKKMDIDLLRRLAQVLTDVSVDQSWSQQGTELLWTVDAPGNPIVSVSCAEAEAQLLIVEAELAQKIMAISRYFELKD